MGIRTKAYVYKHKLSNKIRAKYKSKDFSKILYYTIAGFITISIIVYGLGKFLSKM